MAWRKGAWKTGGQNCGWDMASSEQQPVFFFNLARMCLCVRVCVRQQSLRLYPLTTVRLGIRWLVGERSAQTRCLKTNIRGIHASCLQHTLTLDTQHEWIKMYVWGRASEGRLVACWLEDHWLDPRPLQPAYWSIPGQDAESQIGSEDNATGVWGGVTTPNEQVAPIWSSQPSVVKPAEDDGNL